MTNENKEELKIETIVVEQIPQVPQRDVMGEDKKQYSLITRDEALTEILSIVKELKRKLL